MEKIFFISYVNYTSIYISKPEWIEDNKDRGIYSIAFEKWKNQSIIGIVRNKLFTTNTEKEIIKALRELGYKNTQWWIGYLSINEEYLFNDKKLFIDEILQNYDNLIEKLLLYIKKVYKDITQNDNLLNLFDESVKERKEQLKISN